MTTDMVLPLLREMRDESRAFREETRDNFKSVFHRLAIVETHVKGIDVRLASVEKQMAALLLVVPVLSERMDKLEERIAALESR